MLKYSSRSAGFSLIEILITLVVSSIISATVFSVFKIQSSTFEQQSDTLEVQQNLRSAMRRLSFEFRQACIDTNSEDTLSTQFLVASTNEVSLSSILDWDDIDNNNDGTIDESNELSITHLRYDGSQLLKTDSADANETVFADNVVAASFCYLMQNDTYTDTPSSTSDIRGIEFSLVIESDIIENYKDVDDSGDALKYPMSSNCDVEYDSSGSAHTKKRVMSRTIMLRNTCKG